MFIQTTLAAVAALALTACASQMSAPASMAFSQDSLPAAVRVPAGHQVALETVGVGQITYACRAKKDMAGQFEWVFAGPDAKLLNRMGQRVGRYYGPPATWESLDGSKLTATQIAVAPGGMGNIPMQLVQANPVMGSGALTGVTHVQRVATRGGVAPSLPCTSDGLGRREVVQYQADYIFWKPV